MKAFLLAALLLALRADAATRFAFVHEITGNALEKPRRGAVVIDGDSYRVDYVPPKLELSSILSTDAGKTETALNAELRTYFDRKTTKHGLSLLAMIPLGRVAPAVTVKNLSVTEEPTEERIAGLTTRKYVVRLEYVTRTDVGSEIFSTTYTATGEIWTTDAIESPLDPFHLGRVRTTYEVVDEKLREALSVVKGFPLMRRLAVSRKIANGRAQTEMHFVRFSDFEVVAVPPQTFSVPAGYKYQEPVVGFAGMR